jgi:hypothetical protein
MPGVNPTPAGVPRHGEASLREQLGFECGPLATHRLTVAMCGALCPPRGCCKMPAGRPMLRRASRRTSNLPSGARRAVACRYLASESPRLGGMCPRAWYEWVLWASVPRGPTGDSSRGALSRFVSHVLKHPLVHGQESVSVGLSGRAPLHSRRGWDAKPPLDPGFLRLNKQGTEPHHVVDHSHHPGHRRAGGIHLQAYASVVAASERVGISAADSAAGAPGRSSCLPRGRGLQPTPKAAGCTPYVTTTRDHTSCAPR